MTRRPASTTMPAGGTSQPHRIQLVQDPKVARRQKRERDQTNTARATLFQLETLVPAPYWPDEELPRRNPAPTLAVLKAATAYINYLVILVDLITSTQAAIVPE